MAICTLAAQGGPALAGLDGPGAGSAGALRREALGRDGLLGPEVAARVEHAAADVLPHERAARQLLDLQGILPTGRQGFRGCCTRCATPTICGSYRALAEIDGEAVRARRLQQLLRRALRALRIARQRGIALPRSLLERLERRYDQLVGEALAYHEALPPCSSPSPDGGDARSAARGTTWRGG